ncbi:hypothetical protein ACLKA7_000747 [Drosophila subpalustris]
MSIGGHCWDGACLCRHRRWISWSLLGWRMPLSATPVDLVVTAGVAHASVGTAMSVGGLCWDGACLCRHRHEYRWSLLGWRMPLSAPPVDLVVNAGLALPLSAPP